MERPVTDTGVIYSHAQALLLGTVVPLRMNIRSAFTSLLHKRSLYVSDKLTILANMTHYRHQLDIKKVLDGHLNFTACILALALYNGDLSLLFWYGALFDRSSTQMSPASALPSWLQFEGSPLREIGTTSGMSPHTRFKARTLSGPKFLVISKMALVAGILWTLIPFDGLNTCADRLCQLLVVADDGSSITYDSAQRDSILQLLVEQLFVIGRDDLIELIVTSALRRQLHSPAEIYSILKELWSWMYRNHAWPGRILSDTLLESQGSGTHPRSTKESLFDCILASVARRKPLVVGECVLQNERRIVSLFTLEPGKYGTVFTPLSELEYEYGHNPWIHMAPKDSFWPIKPCSDEVGGEERLKATERLGDIVHEIYLSNEIWEVQGWVHARAVWSPRLSQTGLLEQDRTSEAWQKVLMGRGK